MPTGDEPVRDVFTRPSPARIHSYWVGGKDHLAVDREVAVKIARAAPHVIAGVRANRAFLRRAVTYLAEAGVGQFLVLGSGLPAADGNVHQIAGRIDPRSRVLYVDKDPVVLAYARALLADRARTVVVEGDIREPERILHDRQVREHLDFDRPVAVICAGILHYVPDEEDPWGIVRTFRDRLAEGSYLVVSHVTYGGDDQQDAGTRAGAQLYSATIAPFAARSREDIERFFSGFSLVEPGLTSADEWRRRANRKTWVPVLAGVGTLRFG